MASKNNARGMVARQASNNSLGMISEDGLFGSDPFGIEDDEEDYKRRDLFHNELSVIDSRDATATPTASSVFIDLEAEERSFVTGSQLYLDAMETIKQLKQRLIRRTSIIDEIRKYYLRDVVTVKHILKDVLTTRERQQVLKMYDENLPSIDLKAALALHAPTKCEMQVSQCGECGGQLEIIMKDSNEVDMLKKTIIDCKDRESRFRIKLATLDAQIENATRERGEANKTHAEEKKYLYTEMKKVKADAEKVHKNLESVSQANKRLLGENGTLQSRLNTLSSAAQQLEQGSQEIADLRNEVDELSLALKNARHNEKHAVKELNDHHLELKAQKLKNEEHIETINTLLVEKAQLNTELAGVGQQVNEWTTTAHLTSEQLREEQERCFDLDTAHTQLKHERDQLLDMLHSADDSGVKKDLLEAREEGKELREENRRLKRDHERVKRQLDKAQELRLVLEHDLAVAIHEQKEQEAELHSITDYLHAKVTGGSGGEPEKIDDVIRSMKMNARSKVGEKPQPSARVATFKSRGSEEQLEGVGTTSRGASRGSNRCDVDADGDEEGDNAFSDNDAEPNDGDDNDGEGEEGNEETSPEKRGRSKTAKRGDKGRKSKSPHPNKDASAGSGSASPPKRARRPSLDNIGKFSGAGASASAAKGGVSLTSLAAAKKSAAVVKSKSANKTAKKRRGSFVGTEKPDAGEESDHDEEKDADGDDGGGKFKRTSTEPAKVKRTKTTSPTKARRGSFSNDPELPSSSSIATTTNNTSSRPSSRTESRVSPSKAKKSSKSSKTTTAEDATPRDDKLEIHSDEEHAGSGDEEGYFDDCDDRDYDHVHDHDPEETDGVIAEYKQPRVRRNRSSSPSKRPSSNSQIRKSRDFDSGDANDGRGTSRDGPRARRGSVIADPRPNSKNIKAAAQAEEGALKSRKHVNVKKVNVNLSDSAKIQSKPALPKVVKRVRKVKQTDPSDLAAAAAEGTEIEHEGNEGEEEEEEEEEVEIEEEEGEDGMKQVAEGEGEHTGEEEGDTAHDGNDTADDNTHEEEQDEDVHDFDNIADAVPSVSPPPPLPREPSNKLTKQDSLPKKPDPPVASPEPARASPALGSSVASRRGSTATLPLPKRRRSIPKSFSFMRQSLSTDVHGHNASNVSAALAAVNAAHNPQSDNNSMDDERKEEIKADFAEGLYRSAEPKSIADEDDDPKDRAHIKFVPIIPIEVRRYVGKEDHTKKKFVPSKEEVVVLEPLSEEATPFETALRGELLKAMKLFPTAKESEVNKMLNASRDVMHKFCNMFSTTLESNWASLQAARTALDLHYVIKHVIEGMSATCDAKAGSVELAEICKRILPVAGTPLVGPAATLQWQEEVHLNDVLLTSLLPVVDSATGKMGPKSMSDFFNTKMLHPTSKVRGANNLVLEKIVCASENAHLMQSYAASTNALLSDKLSVVLNDWAKAKAAYYDMDNKIALEKDKVRKVLEVWIADLTKEKSNLGVLCNKHETRIKALEHTESELATAQKTIKSNLSDLDEKKATIEEFESAVGELHSEIDALKSEIAKKSEQMGLLEAQIVVLKQEEGRVQGVVIEKDQIIHQVTSEKMNVTEERDHFQAQYERMLAQEDSRLNKLVSVYMQVEPLVQDLAIQTEFVAPPMNLRTMVAAKNARGKKAPLIFSQSLEVPPSDPGALTSTMVDSASSTYNPLSNHIAAVITARTPQGFPFSQSPDLNSSSGPLNALSSTSNSFYHHNTLSARSNKSVEGRLGSAQFPSSPTLRQRHGLSREDSRQSREDSFFLNAADFLAATPINYELSSRNMMPTDSYQEISRLLAPSDDASITSSRSLNHLRPQLSIGNASHHSQSSHTSHTGKIHRKKAVKLARLSTTNANKNSDPNAGSSGLYQHVHNEDKIPEWGSIHASGPVKSANIDPHVVLGISGVSSLVGQSKPSLSDSRNSAFAGHNTSSGTVNTQSHHSAVRTHNIKNASFKNSLDLEVGLPEVKVQAYHIPTSQPYATPNNYSPNPQHASTFRAVPLQNAPANFNDSAYFESSPTSRGSHKSFGLGSTSPSEKEYMRQSEQMYLMLDSPSLGGQSGYPNFDFDKDRNDPVRLAGELPSSQESVQGIVYNHRTGDQFRLEEGSAGQESPISTHSRAEGPKSNASVGNNNSVHSTQSTHLSTVASTKVNTQLNAGKGSNRGNNAKNNPSYGTSNTNNGGTGTHNAVSNMNEDVLKRLRKELLSR